MNILNDLKSIKQLDVGNMLGSIELLSQQMKQMWQEHGDFKLPAEYKKIKNVVVAGMGGSALPARIVKSVFKPVLPVPVEIVNDYSLPAFVNSETLVVLSSYSGSTEETIAGAAQAKERKAKIVVIATGQDLDKLHKQGAPGIIFNPKFNPCASPRMGLGYQLIGQFLIFRAAGLLSFTEADFKRIVKITEKRNLDWGVKTIDNLIKTTAKKILGRAVLFFAAEHLTGSAHAAANQMNENGKRLAVSFTVPELNHHLMEGLKFPHANVTSVAAVIFNSKLYDKKIQKRLRITNEVLGQNKIERAEILFAGATSLEQIFEALVASSYLSYYLALLENIDPTPIPYVDYFKKQMSK